MIASCSKFQDYVKFIISRLRESFFDCTKVILNNFWMEKELKTNAVQILYASVLNFNFQAKTTHLDES